MATRNKIIQAVSPVVIEATNDKEAQEAAVYFEKIAKKLGGFKLTDLFKADDNSYIIQFGFTNLDMYQKYLKEAQNSGLL